MSSLPTKTPQKEALVIGSGVSGLYSAYRLLKRGIRATIIEAESEPGGLLASFPVGKTHLEYFYHHIFKDDLLIIDTCRALGISLDWTETNTCFLGDDADELQELSAPKHVFTFKTLSFRSRIDLLFRLARVYYHLKRQGGDVSRFDDMTIDRWFGSSVTRDVYKKFFSPMVRKKWGARAPEISAAWLLGRLGMRSGRTSKGERLGYPVGGFRFFVDRCVESIEKSGGRILTGTAVRSIDVNNGSVIGITTSNGALPADIVISTVSPEKQIPLLQSPELKADREVMQKVPYQASLTVIIGLSRPLTPYYWINVLDEHLDFGAIVEHTNFRPVEDYGGPLIYLASYPDPDSKLWDADDRTVTARYTEQLARKFSTFHPADIRWSKVVRTNEASPVYIRGYKRLIPPFRSQIKGLYFTGMFNCYPKRPIDLAAANACLCADSVHHDFFDPQGTDPLSGHRPRTIDP